MAEINDDMDRTRATTAAKAAYEAKSFEVENVLFFVEKVKRTTKTFFLKCANKKCIKLNFKEDKVRYCSKDSKSQRAIRTFRNSV